MVRTPANQSLLLEAVSDDDGGPAREHTGDAGRVNGQQVYMHKRPQANFACLDIILRLHRHKKEAVFYSKNCLERTCQYHQISAYRQEKSLFTSQGTCENLSYIWRLPRWPPNSTSVCSCSCTTRVSVAESKLVSPQESHSSGTAPESH